MRIKFKDKSDKSIEYMAVESFHSSDDGYLVIYSFGKFIYRYKFKIPDKRKRNDLENALFTKGYIDLSKYDYDMT